MRWSYTDQGPRSRHAIVFHPGPTDSVVSYQQVLALLPADLRAIALSPLGHGDSEKPDRSYGIADFAADVIDFLNDVGVARAVLVAHSGSCLVARRVCLDTPERIAGLVLEAAPTTLRGNPDLRALVDNAIAALSDPIDGDFARSWIADTSSAGLDASFVDALIEEVRKVPARVWRAMFASLATYDDAAELSDLSAPTLLIWGDADGIVPRAMQDELRERLAAARLEVYAGVGHTPRWEDPARFARDVAAFARPLLD